jgi:hypothetical protein
MGTKLLGKELGGGLLIEGMVITHLNQVSPFWGLSAWMEGPAELSWPLVALGTLPELGRSSVIVASNPLFHQCLSCTMVGIGGAVGCEQCNHLSDAVLIIVVGLLEAALNGDDPVRARHL